VAQVERRAGLDLLGLEAGCVDRGVPRTALERRGVGAVADHVLGAGIRLAVEPAAVDRDLVAALQRCVDHMATEEHGPTKDEELHNAQLISCA